MTTSSDLAPLACGFHALEGFQEIPGLKLTKSSKSLEIVVAKANYSDSKLIADCHGGENKAPSHESGF